MKNSFFLCRPTRLLGCNAGGGGTPSCDSDSSESWEYLIKKNLFTTVNSVRSSETLLAKSQSSSIVCISSICGSVVVTDAPIGYSCSKAAINMFVRCKAVELSHHGIRINAIEPGNILFPGSVWDKRSKTDPQTTRKFLAVYL